MEYLQAGFFFIIIQAARQDKAKDMHALQVVGCLKSGFIWKRKGIILRRQEDKEFCYKSTICNITKSSLAGLHANLVFEHHVCVKRFSTVKTCTFQIIR